MKIFFISFPNVLTLILSNSKQSSEQSSKQNSKQFLNKILNKFQDKNKNLLISLYNLKIHMILSKVQFLYDFNILNRFVHFEKIIKQIIEQ